MDMADMLALFNTIWTLCQMYEKWREKHKRKRLKPKGKRHKKEKAEPKGRQPKRKAPKPQDVRNGRKAKSKKRNRK